MRFACWLVWRFKLDNRIEEVKVSGEFRSDNSEAIYETALRDRGIGLVASYLCRDSIEKGDLVPLLPDWTSVPEAGVYIAYSSSRHLAPKGQGIFRLSGTEVEECAVVARGTPRGNAKLCVHRLFTWPFKRTK